MARYTPEFIAHVRHRYEDTDDTLETIAADCKISERTVNRIRDREGWKRRSDREPLGLTRAMRLRDGANALLTAKQAAAPPPGDAADGDAAPIGAPAQPAATSAIAEEPVPPEPLTPADYDDMADNLARGVERQIASVEKARAKQGALSRFADAERAARTLSILTQTLHALTRLRGGAAPDSGSHDDDHDTPRDIDEFRRDLARRIDAFVASRTDARHAPGDSVARAMDEAR